MNIIGKILCILLLINLVFPLPSCGNNVGISDESSDTWVDNGTETEGETETVEPPADPIPYFDRMKTSKPTDEAVQKVEVGMSMREVISIIDYPHGYRNGRIFWETDTGKCFSISVICGDGRKYEDFEEVKYDGFVASITFYPFANTLGIDLIDVAQSHRPTEAEVLSIEDGTTLEEVYDRIGYPHGHGRYDGLFGCYWETENGKIFTLIVDQRISVSCTEDCTHPYIQDLYAYYLHGKVLVDDSPEIEEIPEYDILREMPPSGTETTEFIRKTPYFDRMKTSKPTDEAVQKVEVGMTMREVIDLIGYPHGTRESGLFWEAESGSLFQISINAGNGQSYQNFNEIKYTGVVSSIKTPPLSYTIGFIDAAQKRRPTEEEVLSIENGTPMEEVYERIGYPHGYGWYSALVSFYWETENGRKFTLRVNHGDAPACTENCTHLSSSSLPSYYFHGKAWVDNVAEIDDISNYSVFRD